MKISKICAALILGLSFAAAAHNAMAQDSFALEQRVAEPRFIIDMPTAGMLHRGQFALDAWVFRGGGMTIGIEAGIFNRFMFGISYGGNNVIGTDDITGQKLPGVNFKYRFIEESFLLPAFVIGFDSQGKEGYIASADRYIIKSPGFYVAASKNYSFLGSLSIHGCVNYSLENVDSKSPDLSAGAEKSLGDAFVFLASYDFALNDRNATPGFGEDRGYLDAGVRFIAGGGLSIELDDKNILGNEQGVPAGDRTLYINYTQNF